MEQERHLHFQILTFSHSHIFKFSNSFILTRWTQSIRNGRNENLNVEKTPWRIPYVTPVSCILCTVGSSWNSNSIVILTFPHFHIFTFPNYSPALPYKKIKIVWLPPFTLFLRPVRALSAYFLLNKPESSKMHCLSVT